MPKSAKADKREILVAAANIVQRDGEQALNARAIARELKCSTQPIYTVFRNMEELRHALVAEAKARYRAHIDAYLARGGVRYHAFGMGFVRFARDEKGLFRFLFLGTHAAPDPFIGDVVGEMVERYGMSEEVAQAFHADMAVFSFGLAVLVNANSNALSEEEISEAFNREFYALYGYYFPDKPKFWE